MNWGKKPVLSKVEEPDKVVWKTEEQTLSKGIYDTKPILKPPPTKRYTASSESNLSWA
jgi:hypothetical protein